MDFAGQRVRHLDQHLALPEMRVLGGLRDRLDRRDRDLGGEQGRDDVIDGVLGAPFRDRHLARVVEPDAARSSPATSALSSPVAIWISRVAIARPEAEITT